MESKLQIGDRVFYYEGDYEAPSGHDGATWRGTNGTRWHPAVVNQVWSDTCCNLTIFFDVAGPQCRTSQGELPPSVFAEGVHCTNSGWARELPR